MLSRLVRMHGATTFAGAGGGGWGSEHAGFVSNFV